MRGFFKGGALGALIVAALLLLLVAVGSGRRARGELVVVVLVAAVFVGGGVGGTIGATRASAARRQLVWRAGRRLAVEPAEPARADLRFRLGVSALYALALASLGTVAVIGVLGRWEVADLVNQALPYAVGSVQARVMVAGTLFVCAFAAIAGLSLHLGRAAGLGPAERRLVAGAGFLTGVLLIPSLAVVLG